MSKKELVLFSGGPDSALLLQYFLEQKKNVHVVYNECNYNLHKKLSTHIQTQVVTKCLHFFRKKYGHFDFTQTGIYLGIPNSANKFGTDDQWNVFMGSLICREFDINNMWYASFTYNLHNRKIFNIEEPYWLSQENMNPWIGASGLDPKDIKFLTPRNFYNGTEIDGIQTKKEAWDYLDKELQQIVRSCESLDNINFCGKCRKCLSLIYFKIKDKYGNNL
jgi:hypothetical protein